MSNLINKIKQAQIEAGESTVINNLKEKGLIPVGKERCPYELFVIKYFGIPDNTFDRKVTLAYADIVNALCMFTEELPTPPATVSTQNEITNLCDIAINHCDKYLSDGQIHHNSLKQTFVSIRHLASTPPATVIQPLQWVKAKDDFPKEKGNYFLRHPYEDGRFHGWWAYVVPEAIDKEYWIKMGYEWLSESTPPNQLSGIEVKELAQAHAKAYGSHPLGHETSFYDGFKAGYAASEKQRGWTITKASEGDEAIGDVTCVFCNDVCEPAPTKRGWSKIRNRHGLHFDCAKKVSDQGEVINKIEFLTWLRENGWLHNPYKSNDELIDEYNNR